jgi:hypothetical protein
MLAYKAEEHQHKSFLLLIVVCIKIIVSLVATIMKTTSLKREVFYYSVIGTAAIIFTACVLLSAHGIALLLGTTL